MIFPKHLFTVNHVSFKVLIILKSWSKNVTTLYVNTYMRWFNEHVDS